MQTYSEEHIRSLDWREHIRLRPGMYIGKLGDGSAEDDGIYVLLKEVVDNSIDEFVMGAGKEIHITVTGRTVTVRDFGRGIPLGKIIDCVSKINTGGKYDSAAFKKSVGLNGVGTKAVNALSTSFCVRAFRDGQSKSARFTRGVLSEESKITATKEPNGTEISFTPDEGIFTNFHFVPEFIEGMVKKYVYLNSGLTIVLNECPFVSKHGLLDLLTQYLDGEETRYPIVHIRGQDIELAFTHCDQYGETYYSFVNGQYTSMGGSHQTAFREGLVRAVRDHFKRDFDASDVRAGFTGAIAIRIESPVFESQTKTKLGSTQVSESDGLTVRSWIVDFMRQEVDNALHRHPESAKAMLARIQQAERERKEMAGIRKLANERAKKANVFNRKLRDCRTHLDSNHKDRELSTIFITEGDSASGSLTKARDVQTQAVFSLRGKPLNTYGMTKKVVYENEEFNLLQHALNIEDSMDNLRYQRIVLATDADVDGLHIRLLLMTFFLQYFPDLVRQGHVFVLQTPLFRVRSKKTTIYCYSDEEKFAALSKLDGKPEITRFKGLGEISPDEFGQFIGPSMRLDPVRISSHHSLQETLRYYMGKNTQQRQDFIMDNLRINDLTTQG